ncbi:MAG TPA: hypothetical protein VF711_03030 [Acidimicrobiales bacterium]
MAFCIPLVAGLMGLMFAVSRTPTGVDEDNLRRQLMAWTIGSLFLHLAIGMIVTHSSLLNYLGPDALSYDKGAVGILLHWTKGFPFPTYLGVGKEGFYYLLAGIYWIFGASTAAGLVFNATLGAALVPLLADTTRRLFGRAVARYAVPLAVLIPGVLIWSSQLLKEACVLFLIAVAANAAVRLSERVTPMAIVALTGSIALMMTFRAPIGLVVAAGILVGLAAGRQQLLGGLTAVLGPLVLIAILVVSVGFGYAGYRSAIHTDLAQAQVVRAGLAANVGSGFAEEADVSTTRGAVSYLPRGLVANVLGPFPWQLSGVRQLPALADVAVWWCLLPSLWRARNAGRRGERRRLLVLVAPAVAMTIVLSLTISNFGTVVRERTQVIVMVLPLIAFGLAQRRPVVGSVTETRELPAS